MQRKYVAYYGCDKGTKEERKKCLMNLPAEKFSIMKTHFAYMDFPMRYSKSAEVYGFIFVDPTVITVSPRNLKSAEFKHNSKVPIIMSNLAEETSILQLPGSEFKSDKQIFDTMELLFKNITSEAGIVDVVKSLYPGATAQQKWDKLTTDMRSTCPTNDISEEMAKNVNYKIYRLYISHQIQVPEIKLPSFHYPGLTLPTYHAYDSDAMFGFKYYWYTELTKESKENESKLPEELRVLQVPMQRDLKFQQHYLHMVHKLAKDKEFSDGWTEFPGNSMIYDNGDDISKIIDHKPQHTVCEKLEELDMVKYGWQNK